MLINCLVWQRSARSWAIFHKRYSIPLAANPNHIPGFKVPSWVKSWFKILPINKFYYASVGLLYLWHILENKIDWLIVSLDNFKTLHITVTLCCFVFFVRKVTENSGNFVPLYSWLKCYPATPSTVYYRCAQTPVAHANNLNQQVHLYSSNRPGFLPNRPQ